jgi:hypothetical protein
MLLPAVSEGRPEAADFVATWRGETAQTATVVATIALALLAMGAAPDAAKADAQAAEIWGARKTVAI